MFVDMFYVDPTGKRCIFGSGPFWFYIWLQTPRRCLFFILVLTTLANQLPFLFGADKLEAFNL